MLPGVIIQVPGAFPVDRDPAVILREAGLPEVIVPEGAVVLQEVGINDKTLLNI